MTIALGEFDAVFRLLDARRRVARPALVSATGTTLLIAAALLLTARRMAGALVEPPSPILAAVCSSTILIIWIAASSHERRKAEKLVSGRSFAGRWLPLVRFVAAARVVGALTLPGTSTASAGLLWLPIVGIGGVLLYREWRQFVGAPDRASRDRRMPLGVAEHRISAEMTRRIDSAGSETISGTLTVDLAVGQRSAAAHVAFCPPLGSRPQIEAAVVDESDAEVKVSQALPYAARFDVRLAEPADEPTSVRIRFDAASPSSPRSRF